MYCAVQYTSLFSHTFAQFHRFLEFGESTPHYPHSVPCTLDSLPVRAEDAPGTEVDTELAYLRASVHGVDYGLHNGEVIEQANIMSAQQI